MTKNAADTLDERSADKVARWFVRLSGALTSEPHTPVGMDLQPIHVAHRNSICS